MERLATWLSLLLLVAMAAGTMWFADKTRRDLLESLPKEPTNDPDYMAEDFTVIRSDLQGRPVVRLSGTRFVHTPMDERSVMHKVNTLSLGTDRPRATVTADEAVGSNEMQTVDLKGNVRYDRAAYKTSQPMNLRTSALRLFPDDDVVTTDQPFKIESGMPGHLSVITGKQLRLDNVQQSMLITGQSHAMLTPRNGRVVAPPAGDSINLVPATTIRSTVANAAAASGVSLR